MDLKLKIANCLYWAETFEINGVKAYSDDFGKHYDDEPENAEPYGCGNMTFFAKESTPEILKKYKISQSEYEEIAVKLTEGLSFGQCGWCV